MPTINSNVVLAGVAYAVLSALFNFAFAHKSQIETWSLSKPKLAAFLKLTRAIGIDPWGIAASALLLFKGRLPVAQQNGAKAVTALLVAQGNNAVSTLPDRMYPSVIPPVAALLLAVCFALHATACASVKPFVKDIDTASVILCDIFFSEQPQNVSLSPADVEKAFCSTAEQVAPFLDSAKKAVGRGGAIRLAKDPQ